MSGAIGTGFVLLFTSIFVNQKYNFLGWVTCQEISNSESHISSLSTDVFLSLFSDNLTARLRSINPSRFSYARSRKRKYRVCEQATDQLIRWNSFAPIM